MNKTNSIIEVNGNRYDAVTGKLLSAGKKINQLRSNSGKRVIDGFVIGAHHTKSQVAKSKLARTAVHKQPAQGLHRSPERPKTLIRTAVKKPAKGDLKAANTKLHQRAEIINPAKELRAKTVAQHSKVNRFGHFSKAQQVTKLTEKTNYPAQKSAQVEVAKQQPRVPSMITSVSHRKLEQMLDEGLMKANAHKHMLNQHRPAKRWLQLITRFPRWVSFSLVGFLVIFAAAFLVWQNLPAVAVHVAAAKSHVNASIPGYMPTGFGYAGHLNYSPGSVTMQFKDKNAPSQTFSLTQKLSNWDSSSLQANVLPKEAIIQTNEVKGTTVYIYGDNSDATWVNHSVLYKLKNKANLPSDQVLRIVQSL